MACRDGRDCIKFVVYFLNACLLILGIGIAGVAGYIAFNTTSSLHNAITAANLPGTMTGLHIMFASGLVIAVVAILACLATSGENKLMLWLTFFLILLLLIMQLVALILCFYKYRVVEKQLTTLLRDSVLISSLPFNSGLSGFGKLLRGVIGQLETSKQCCGLNGPGDYGSTIPKTCYPPSKRQKSSAKGDSLQETGPIESKQTGIDGEKAVGQGTAALEASSKATMSSSTSSSFLTTTGTTIATNSPSTEAPETTTTPSLTTSTTPGVLIGSTTVITEKVAATSDATTEEIQTTKHGVTTKPAVPYQTGCFQRFKPIIAAAGGVGIAVLVAEFLLLICIGLLLCEVGKEYDRIA